MGPGAVAQILRFANPAAAEQRPVAVGDPYPGPNPLLLRQVAD
jgi:hypothetical protein